MYERTLLIFPLEVILSYICRVKSDLFLQYVYEPTGSIKFLRLDFYFPLDALHVSDYISPSSGATL